MLRAEKQIVFLYNTVHQSVCESYESDQQKDAAAEGADIIIRSVDVYDVVSVCVGGGGGRC